jgi:hypothetical protein
MFRTIKGLEGFIGIVYEVPNKQPLYYITVYIKLRPG